MTRNANYVIRENTKERIVLEDIGPWDKFMTITNAAEETIEEVERKYSLSGRRLFYYDSEGELTELLIKDGYFADFAPAS